MCSQSQSLILVLELGFNPKFSGSKFPTLSSKSCLYDHEAKKLAEVKVVQITAQYMKAEHDSRTLVRAPGAVQWTRYYPEQAQ